MSEESSSRNPQSAKSRKRKFTSESEAEPVELDAKKGRCTSPKDIRNYVRQLIDPEEDRHLCTRCRAIDFQSIFAIDAGSLKKGGIPVCSLMLEDSMKQVECSLCRVFVAMDFAGLVDSPGLLSTRQCHLRAYGCLEHWYGGWLEDWYGRPWKRRSPRRFEIVLGLCDGRAFKNVTSYQKLAHMVERGVIRQHSPKPSQCIRHRELGNSKPYQTDISTVWIKESLKDCLHSHEACGLKKTTFPHSAWIIDCRLKTVIPLTSRVQYLALSYVWGASPPTVKPVNENTGSDFLILPSELPQTIEDAIKLTLCLGFHYLWVDRYCIKQAHSDDKQRQIRQMANIYSNATATVCALGSSEQAGIPGVSQSYKYIYQAEAQGINLVASLRDFRTFLAASIWKTRGWTLQELVLSARCLFCTDEGITIACSVGVFSEHLSQVKLLLRAYKAYDREQYLFYKNRTYTRYYSAPMDRFKNLRDQYQARDLGYEIDGLNAFQGILATLEASSYWGIAIFRHQIHYPDTSRLREEIAKRIRAAFNWGLCWHVAQDAQTARQCGNELPSWSWTTQRSRIVDAPVFWIPGDPVELLMAKVQIIHPSGDTVSVEEFFLRNNLCAIMPQESRMLEIRSMMMEWREISNYRDQEGFVSIVHPTWTSIPDWLWKPSMFHPRLTLDDRPSATRQQQSENARPLHGSAILILKNGFDECWLAISEIENGIYRREGILWGNSRLIPEHLPDDALRTIKLV